MKLRTKITILTTVIAVSVVFFTLLPIRALVINAFRGELEKKAVSITANLSDRIANNIVLKDHFQTAKAFNEVLDKEKDIEYIFVTDEEGRMFAHTFDNGTPPGILSWNPLSGRIRNIQFLDTEAGYIRDVGISVFPGTKSELHVGIREEGLRQTLVKMRYMTIPIIIIVMFTGFIASFIFSRMVTGPLNKFVEFTKVLGKGKFGERVDVPYGDEIGYLARNFNRLSMQLKTAQEKMEEAYTYTHLLQAEKLSSIGQISAGLAHELKNPMTTLKMLFQAYQEQPDMTKEDAEVISSEIERIDNILTNFMGFVKQKGFKMADVDLNDLLDRVLSLATYDIEHSGITVHKDMIEDLPTVKADRSLLDHVFLNLIMNSIQAMPEGGDIRVSGKSEDDFVEIMIWDKGGGIPSDIRSKIFDPFFTTKDQGTGLGLSIAYNIVKSHGGKLFFNSTEGKGTVFTVKLPKGDVNE
ncbi:sensor protein ZraS [bacterium BMS3Abin09]|nr:sensor protein ZraS [bacterium BMS3Abin09]GBE40515.1 sensor protein ZraS [bacterium BMS3Bbin09]